MALARAAGAFPAGCPPSYSLGVAAFVRDSFETSPRVLRVDLGRGARGSSAAAAPEAWSHADPSLDAIGRWSGAALALALLEDAARRSAPTPLVVAVGECVRRGVPTAARATIASRAPLTGRVADGQVGGRLGRRLASVLDALVVQGRTSLEGAVLVLEAGGRWRLEARPELRGLSPRATQEHLQAWLGDVTSLCVGPAGERGLPIASLVASGDPPHYVGRGGLGAVLGRAGLKAIAIVAPAIEGEPQRELHAALAGSPRLEARAREGTIELFGAHAARGALALGGERAAGAGDERGAQAGRQVAAELDAARATRHGCSGCPTPCGWVFARPAGAQPARFGATHALGLKLGFAHADAALELLGRCDDLGVDAKEIGAGLVLLCEGLEAGRVDGPPAWGDLARLGGFLDELEGGAGLGAGLGAGSAALAAELGLPRAALDEARREPGARDPAGALGAAVATRGADPMRSFPFLVHDGGDRALLERLVAPLALPPGAEDPRRGAGKGRLVWWHENLSAALDATGFCSFSAAALLSDGGVELEQLARWIGPDALLADAGAGEAAGRLAAMGAALVHLARRLDERWGEEDGRAPFAPGAGDPLADGELFGEYARLRGLEPDGSLTADERARFDADVLGLVRGRGGRAPESPGRQEAEPELPVAPMPVRPGRVFLTASGPLADALAGLNPLSMELPARLEQLFERLAGASPTLGAWFAPERPRPVVYRAGSRLGPGDAVHDGDRLDLVLVISGGAR